MQWSAEMQWCNKVSSINTEHTRLIMICIGWSKPEMKKERECYKSDKERRKKKKSKKVTEQWKTLRMR